jgi:hypothetical protein
MLSLFGQPINSIFVILSVAKNPVHLSHRRDKILRCAQNDRKKRIT